MSNPENYIDRVTIKGVTYLLRDSTVIDGVATGLPPVTIENENSILLVKNGSWQVTQIATAEDGEF